MIYWISVYILKFIAKIYHRGEAYGIENLPKKGPFIGVINHSSNMDVVATAMIIKHKVYTMAKESLFRVPVLKWWLRAVGMFPVIRNTSDVKAFTHAVKLLKSGKVLFMAPEGTRRKKKGQRLRPKTGFVRLAQTVDCPVVPIAVYGTDKVLPPGAWFPRPVKVKVMVGKPIKLEKLEKKFENKEKLQQQADMVMDKVYEMIAQLEGKEEIIPVVTDQESGSPKKRKK